MKWTESHRFRQRQEKSYDQKSLVVKGLILTWYHRWSHRIGCGTCLWVWRHITGEHADWQQSIKHGRSKRNIRDVSGFTLFSTLKAVTKISIRQVRKLPKARNKGAGLNVGLFFLDFCSIHRPGQPSGETTARLWRAR
jgi:hypothetical protein